MIVATAGVGGYTAAIIGRIAAADRRAVIYGTYNDRLSALDQIADVESLVEMGTHILERGVVATLQPLSVGRLVELHTARTTNTAEVESNLACRNLYMLGEYHFGGYLPF